MINIRTKLNKLAESIKKMPARQLQIRLALIILAFGIASVILLKIASKAPGRIEYERVTPLVKVQMVHQRNIQMIVHGDGTVQPKVQAEVVPQVHGKVVQINPNFKNGGFVRAGQPLITIDPRDYELSVQRAEAEVEKAKVELDLEKAEALVARQEWEQLNPGQQPPSPLIVHQPQIRQAQTRLQAAKAELTSAQLGLERTKVSLPFDGRVVNETVDLGQYVTAGQSIGKVYGIETVEIEVPLEDSELAWFDIPANPVFVNGRNSSTIGAKAEVRSRFAGSTHTWPGQVIRTTGLIDQSSRLVTVVVEVTKPFKTADGRPPLIPGMFVEVVIMGKTLENVIAVPRYVVHNRNQVWVVENGRLYVRPLDIVRVDRNFAYVTSGIDDKAVVITSSMDVVADGMEVRLQAEAKPSFHSESLEANSPKMEKR